MAKPKPKKGTPAASDSQPRQSKCASRKLAFDENALSKLVKNLDTKFEGDEPTLEKKGKKRSRDGAILPSSAASQNDRLKEEILALGGTEEDFDLINGVDSASELEEPAASSKKSKLVSGTKHLVSEISKMVQDVEIPGDAGSSAEITEDESGNGDADAGLQGAQNRGVVGKQSSRGQANLHLNPQADWYNVQLPPLRSLPSEVAPLSKHLVDRIHQHATDLLETEIQAYKNGDRSSSSQKFYTTMAASGTLDDKIAALTLAVQESPIHNMKALENLLNLAGKRSRGQAINVLKALKDLFAQGTLLPPNRRLKAFAAQPDLAAAFAGHNDWTPDAKLPERVRPAHLMFWAFESWVKDQYFEILKILETWCNDEIEFTRRQSVSYVYELLENKPEQESNLLRLLVNKLGDPDKKIASRTSYLILKLEEAHPRMKNTIIAAIQSDVLFRPGQSQHAKYYAIITLNQTVLSSREEEVASKLLDVYFSLFIGLLRPVDEKKDEFGIPERFKSTRKKKKSSPGAKSASKAHIPEDEMRERLIAGVLTGVNRAYPYTNSDSSRLSKHIDTLFKITHSSNFNTSIQALMLVQQLSTSHQVSTERFFRTLYESLLDPRVLTTSKQTMYMNLLYKALKEDVDVNRVRAFIKRLVQVLGMHEPSFTYGSFHLSKELEKTFPSIASLVDQPEKKSNDDDEEEIFRDVPEEGVTQPQPASAAQDTSSGGTQPTNQYDPRKRDPSHASAETSCLWELLPFLAHFHPSISLGASSIISHTKLEGNPDLTQHTLKHFLDRFVYRNPKSSATGLLRGSSIMQPLAGAGEANGLLVRPDSKARGQIPVNTEGFWAKKTEDVAPEDVFFHQYFSGIGRDKKAAAAKKTTTKTKDADPEGDEDGSLGGDDEDEIWNALVHSRPELEGDSEDDDLDMDDLESDFEKSDDDDDHNEIEAEEDHEAEAASTADKDDEEGLEAANGDADVAASDVSSLDFSASDDEENILDSDASISDAEAPIAPSSSLKGKPAPKRRKVKSLPTFASAEDYAAMLDVDEGEDMG